MEAVEIMGHSNSKMLLDTYAELRRQEGKSIQKLNDFAKKSYQNNTSDSTEKVTTFWLHFPNILHFFALFQAVFMHQKNSCFKTQKTPETLDFTGFPVFFLSSWKRDLNPRPLHYEWSALPTELFQHRSAALLLTQIIIHDYCLFCKYFRKNNYNLTRACLKKIRNCLF